MPRLRLHDLRHTHASLMLKERVPIKVVSERLGHATPGFTMATYQHVLPGMQADAAQIFANLLSSTGFNPVEGSVERPLGAEKSGAETASDLDFLSGVFAKASNLHLRRRDHTVWREKSHGRSGIPKCLLSDRGPSDAFPTARDMDDQVHDQHD